MARTLAEQLDTACQRVEAKQDTLVRVEHAMVALEALAAATNRLAAVKREAMRELRDSGWSLADIANATGMSRARVQQVTR